MKTPVMPFDFEEQAERVVMRDADQRFVAADLCRVPDIGNPSQAVSRLDNEERMTLHCRASAVGGARDGGALPGGLTIRQDDIYQAGWVDGFAQAKRVHQMVLARWWFWLMLGVILSAVVTVVGA